MDIKKLQIIAICKKLNLDFKDFGLLNFGAHNINYYFNTKQGKFVLRIENNAQSKNLKKEYTYLKKTDGKLGPRVFLFDNTNKIIPRDYLIEEFITGVHPNNRISDDVLKKFGRWFKDLHKNKTDKHLFLDKNKKFDLNLFFNEKYYNSYLKYNSILDLNTKKILEKLNSDCLKLMNLNKKYFLKIKNLSLNHSDPSPSNCFIKDNGELILIDWEFVKYDLPEFDLIFFIWSYELSDKQKKIFLKSYGYSNTKFAKKKYKLIRILMYFSFLNWLFERLDLSIKGKLKAKKGVYCSSKKEIEEKLNSYIKNITKLLNKARLISF